jgi:metallo-beta-lactamase family protein
MKITFHGAAKVVTGSCYLLESEGIKFLVDCGMFQGPKELVRRNYLPFNFDPKEIAFVLITHAHIDHTGLLPKLVKNGFKGKIYCTKATAELTEILLLDSAQIQAETIEQENRRRLRAGQTPRTALYNEADVVKTMKLFSSTNFNTENKIKNISFVLKKAGHILGSSIIELFVEGKKLVFSGDVGQGSKLILDSPDIIKETDYLFMESTYGDRLHYQVDKRLEKLAKIITETFNKGGKLLIPAFAVERTQELLYSLEELYKKKAIPFQKVFLDSPLAIDATKIFKKYSEEYDPKIKFNFSGLESTITRQESANINWHHKPAIIISGSGMCNAGRIRHHIKHQIWNPKNTILFIGYQAVGTLGSFIKSGEKKIKLMGMEILVKAKVETLDSFSGHADQKMLLNWIKGFEKKPKTIFVTHGEPNASKVLSEKINELGIKTKIPNIGDSISL